MKFAPISQSAADPLSHAQHAKAAGDVLARTARGRFQTTEQELMAANAQAILALYELLLERGV
jgi:hypothetical protein